MGWTNGGLLSGGAMPILGDWLHQGHLLGERRQREIENFGTGHGPGDKWRCLTAAMYEV